MGMFSGMVRRSNTDQVKKEDITKCEYTVVIGVAKKFGVYYTEKGSYKNPDKVNMRGHNGYIRLTDENYRNCWKHHFTVITNKGDKGNDYIQRVINQVLNDNKGYFEGFVPGKDGSGHLTENTKKLLEEIDNIIEEDNILFLKNTEENMLSK